MGQAVSFDEVYTQVYYCLSFLFPSYYLPNSSAISNLLYS
jgi:hypothetical protein